MKRVLKIVGIVLAVVLVPLLSVIGSVMYSFNQLAPLPEPASDVAGGARLINDGFAGFYLLPATGGVALVDCGNDENGKVLLDELKKKSLKPEDVTHVFLTHGHPDHTAACHLFPKAEVYAFAGDVDLAAGKARSKGPLPSKFDTPPEKQIKVTKTLIDGETIAVGDRQVSAFAMPGHTAGSASYLSNGLLLMGDNASYDKTGNMRGAWWWFSDDTVVNGKSLVALTAKLKERGDKVEQTVYAHSGPSDGMKALEAFRSEP
jgi:glyoxylase-like metal-dependent hydrolase (beta-lactamase superfamily II)